MGGQAVHHQHILFRGRKQRAVDLVRLKQRLLLPHHSLILAHADPGVGIDDVGIADRLEGIGKKTYVPRAVCLCPRHHRPVRRKAFGAGDPELEAELERRLDPGIGDIISVPHIGDVQVPVIPPLFHNGHEVAQDLAGMQQIGEAVDHRNGGVACVALKRVLGKCSDDQAVQVAGEDPRRVFRRLLPAQLGVPRAHVEGVPAQLHHSHLKGDAGAGRGLLEEQT